MFWGVLCVGNPTFLGNPNCAFALLFDPGRIDASGHLRRANTAPALTTTKAPTMNFRGSITQLQHWLSTLRSAGRPATTQDSLPVAGQALPDGLHTRRVPVKGFKLTSCSLSSSSKLSWRKVRTILPRRKTALTLFHLLTLFHSPSLPSFRDSLLANDCTHAGAYSNLGSDGERIHFGLVDFEFHADGPAPQLRYVRAGRGGHVGRNRLARDEFLAGLIQ